VGGAIDTLITARDFLTKGFRGLHKIAFELGRKMAKYAFAESNRVRVESKWWKRNDGHPAVDGA
jgi:hypothetical protein